MPSLPTNEGTYRGRATGGTAVGTSSGGCPQFLIGAHALEWYDPDAKAWVPWEEYDEAITGYLCLFGKDGNPLKNVTQVMKVFGWDGASFSELNEADYSEVDFQFRVADEEFEGVVRRKLVWIDVADAEPGGGAGTVTAFDPKKCKAMDTQFSKALKKLSGGKVKTAKAPTTPPKATPKATPKTAPKAAEAPATPKATPPKRPPAAPPKSSKAKVEIDYTYDTAWEAVVAASPETDDDDRATVWSQKLDEVVAPGTTEDKITAAEWTTVVAFVLAELATH